jgi:hypothetical protein
MRNKVLLLVGAGLIPLLVAGSASAVQILDGSKDGTELKVLGDHPKKPACGKYGTTVTFLSSPSEAARQAKEQEKLVFVLHVSGHFEDPKFT